MHAWKGTVHKDVTVVNNFQTGLNGLDWTEGIQTKADCLLRMCI